MKIRWLKSERRAQNFFLNQFPIGREPKNRTQLRKAFKRDKFNSNKVCGLGPVIYTIIHRKAWPKTVTCEKFREFFAALAPHFDQLFIKHYRPMGLPRKRGVK